MEDRTAWALGDRRLYLCTPDRPDLARFLTSCIAGGVDVVQLRDKDLADHLLLERAALAGRVCADNGVPFVLNDRPDLAAEAGADGVHVGQDDPTPEDARNTVGPSAIVGLSTHTPDQLSCSIGSPVDYISAGPVAATPTKPGRPGTGLGYVNEATARSPHPVWVTGGVAPTTVDAMAAAGARHFVAVRWLTESADPEESARRLRAAIDRAVERAELSGRPSQG